MIRTAMAIGLVGVIVLAGCANRAPVPRSASDAALFAPVSMRIHPIFTQVKDWTGDDKPDGVEALLEFQDQFNDPTKAAGTAIFELYNYRKGDADPRGERAVNPWVGSLQTLSEQQARWNRTSRTYFFQLEYPGIRDDRNYVLTATFDTGATRFFDQIVLKGENAPRERSRAMPATRPVSPAATRPATPAATAPAVPIVMPAATVPAVPVVMPPATRPETAPAVPVVMPVVTAPAVPPSASPSIPPSSGNIESPSTTRGSDVTSRP